MCYREIPSSWFVIYLWCWSWGQSHFSSCWQAKLQEFIGKKELGKHLDADEAIVLGAALHAANISDGIKLNRKLGMIDGSSYGFVIQLDGPDLSEDESSEQLLVQRMKKLPSKVTSNFTLYPIVFYYTFSSMLTIHV